MAGGRTTEDFADLWKREEGEREINARRLVYRQQSRAKSRGAHPHKHCLFMRGCPSSLRERERQRGRGRTSWAPSDTMSRPIDFIYLKVTLRRALLSRVPLLVRDFRSCGMDRGTRRSLDRRRRKKSESRWIREINDEWKRVCRFAVGDFTTNFIAILGLCTFASPRHFSRNRSSDDFPLWSFPFSSLSTRYNLRYNLFALWILMYAKNDSKGIEW